VAQWPGFTPSGETWVLARFAGPSAFSQSVVLPILAFLFVNSFVAGLFESEQDSLEPLAEVAAATVIAWAFFCVSGLVINAVLPVYSVWRGASILGVFGATELVRICVIFVLSDQERFGGEFGPVFLVLGSITTGVVLFGLVSVAVNDYRDYERAYQEFSLRLGMLSAALAETQAHVELVREQFALSIRGLLGSNLKEAFSSELSDESRRPNLADELFRISDEIVRPLSRGLAEMAPSPPPLPLAAKPRRVPFKTLMDITTSVAPFSPGSFTVIVALITGPTVLLLTSWWQGALWVVTLAAVFASNYVGYRFLTPRCEKVPLLLRMAVMTVVFAFPVAYYIGFVLGPSLPAAISRPSAIAYGAVLGAILGWVPAIADGVKHARGKFLDELERVDQAFHRLQLRAQSQLWLDQKRLALTLHTDVQGALLAAAMKIRNVVGAEPKEVQRVVRAVRKMIEKSVAAAPAYARAKGVAQAVRAINNTWASLLPLTLNARKDVLAVVEGDPLTLEIVTEVLKELHLNSFKHGRATDCVVTLSLPSSDTLLIHLRNSGQPLARRGSVDDGLGGTFLAVVSLSQRAKDVDGGVEIELEIPLPHDSSPKTG